MKKKFKCVSIIVMNLSKMEVILYPLIWSTMIIVIAKMALMSQEPQPAQMEVSTVQIEVRKISDSELLSLYQTYT